MITLNLDLENKEYTKSELMKAIGAILEDGVYKMAPIDPDNFHTKYKMKFIRTNDPVTKRVVSQELWDEFKEKSIKSYKELKIGLKVYNNFSSRTNEIISNVYIINNLLYMDVKTTVNEDDDDTSLCFTESWSLGDRNITNGGHAPWLIFKDSKVAEDFYSYDWLTYFYYETGLEINNETITIEDFKKTCKKERGLRK